MKEKKGLETTLTLLFEGQKLELSSAFVGGYLADETDSPMGMYTGNDELNVGDTSIALIHLLRAVIKMSVTEQNLNYDQANALLLFAVKEAMKSELEMNPEDNKSLKDHEEVLIKIRRDKKH
jgi:hypothetical protein